MLRAGPAQEGWGLFLVLSHLHEACAQILLWVNWDQVGDRQRSFQLSGCVTLYFPSAAMCGPSPFRPAFLRPTHHRRSNLPLALCPSRHCSAPVYTAPPLPDGPTSPQSLCHPRGLVCPPPCLFHTRPSLYALTYSSIAALASAGGPGTQPPWMRGDFCTSLLNLS